MAYRIYDYDPLLRMYAGDIELRMRNYKEKRAELAGKSGKLSDFANGHHYFGIHRLPDGGTVYREWAPGADALHLYGDFNFWDREAHPMTRKENGVWEILLPPEQSLKDGQKYKVLVTKDGVTSEHIPSYATYVTQDPESYIWSAEVHYGNEQFPWEDGDVKFSATPLIYECHIGMATEEYRVGTYNEFRENILPRIQDDGYNTIQIMAVMEHPYYASFGYQVANFFAASSRYGTPEELKMLINEAHKRGIRVLLDVVHSHAVGNEREGLNRFDGTDYQYFHEGEKGNHQAWGTKLFNYGKNEVLHFLLSNLKFWMEVYHFDGFRFDGVTSMLYQDHGLGTSFDNYDKYFSMNTDTEAVTYLMLANELIHEISPSALTIAEDMSGMPGMCLPIRDGGIGFDYRLGMGVPDMWIRILKERNDEDWDLWQIYYELTGRRPKEKNIGYAES
ncbi:MAG: 1,4-alpha-glucan-branching enzyme, partial [Lachnospiraceae bacterium]|nr:1,4-alpha-glucan-branching enzyme [Lachnospiraceae bacterium]